MKRILTLMLAILLFLLPCAATAEHEHAVAYMEIRFSCGCNRGGTGTMVGRYGLITAAHNLYCHEHGSPLKRCDFYFGATSLDDCWYEYNGAFRYWAYDTFRNGYDSDNDIGYVVFPSPVGDETGWFGCKVMNNEDLNGKITQELSYNKNRELQKRYRVLRVLGSKQINWGDGSDGTEGGPIVFASNGQDGGPYVVAVYTSHDDEGKGYGRRLTNDIFRDMRSNGVFD